MNCHAFENLLDELLAARLTPEQRADAEEHAAQCPRCRVLFNVARGNRAAISVAVPEDLTAAILARTSGPACRRSGALLPDFVDGALQSDDAQLVRQHVEHCRQCQSLAQTLGWLTGQLHSMCERDPGPHFTADVLAATTQARRAAPTWWPRWQQWWRRQIVRPRFAMEAAYIGTMILIALCATPVSPLRDAPPRALDVIEAGPARAGMLLEGLANRAGSELSGWSRRAWQETGAGVAMAVTDLQHGIAQRQRRALPAIAGFKEHAADLGQALSAIDFGQAALAITEIRRDLRRAWRLWRQDAAADDAQPVSIRAEEEPPDSARRPTMQTITTEPPRA